MPASFKNGAKSDFKAPFINHDLASICRVSRAGSARRNCGGTCSGKKRAGCLRMNSRTTHDAPAFAKADGNPKF
jgi:hypothetical protein